MRKLGTEGSDPIDKEALACGCETAKAPCGVCGVPKKMRLGLASVLQLAHLTESRLESSMDAIARAREDSSATERPKFDEPWPAARMPRSARPHLAAVFA